MTRIEITYQQILQREPCADGFARLLRGRGLLDDEGLDRWEDNCGSDLPGLPTEPWPLSEALETLDLGDVLWALQCLPEHENLWRKLAVGFAADVRHLMKDGRSLEALRVAWLYSEGLATNAELAAARSDARLVFGDTGEAALAAKAASWAADGRAAAAAAAAAVATDVDLTAATADAADAAWAEMRHKQSARLRAVLEAGEWVGPCPVQELIDDPAFCGVES